MKDYDESPYWQRTALNVFPAMTLGRNGVEDSVIRPKGMMVYAFYGTKMAAYNEIDLKILTDPCDFEASFVVVDIPAAFNLLLRGPCTHSARAIPSDSHQKFKFILKTSSYL